MRNAPVFILGLFDTGLYVAQSFAGKGISVYGFDYDIKKPGFYSRNLIAHQSPNPLSEPDQLYNQLIHHSNTFTLKPVIVPSSEEYVGFIRNYSKLLNEYFEFRMPTIDILDNILNKAGQFSLAKKVNLLVPFHTQISDAYDFNMYMTNYYEHKIILKALDQLAWKAKVKQKAYIISNSNDLANIGNILVSMNISFIIQDVIDGDCSNNFEFNALMLNGEIVESCLIRKLRQYPPEYGAASLIQTCINKEIEDMGRRFVIQNKIEGFSNTEFKLNPSDGKYYFIETNARVWQQIRLTESLGQNFVLTYYNYLANGMVCRNEVPKEHVTVVKWMDIFSDSLLWWRFLRKSGMSFYSYIFSLRGVRNFGLLNMKDICPFVQSVKSMNLFKTKK
jgi:predicted ATP-grasp superfamily ATP-dependent carboligase